MRDEYRYLEVQSIRFPNGRNVSYIQAGSGPDLVIANGLFQRANGLRWLITELSPHFRVTCLVIPGGEGSSPLGNYDQEAAARWVNDVCLALGIKKPVVVTISLGAALGIPYLAFEDGGAEALVVYDPITRVRDTAVRWQILFHLNHYLTKFKLNFLFYALVWFIRSVLLLFDRKVARRVKGTPPRSFSEVGELVYRNHLDSLAQRISGLLPTMCIASKSGSAWLINRRSIAEVMRSMHFSRFVVLDGSEHILQPENQRDLAQEIVQFARELAVI